MPLALGLQLLPQAGSAAPGPVGNGFTVTAGDLSFILKQIKIAERHSRAFEGDATAAPQPNPHPIADPSYCLSMVGGAADQVPDPLTSYGLRTVDGQCNNLTSVLDTTNANNSVATPTYANHPTIGAADQPFPRLTAPEFRTAESNPPAFGPPGPVTSYAQKTSGNVVFDSQPRVISNLIVDQTSTNPAAVAAAGFPVRAQNGGNPTVPCATNPDGSDVIPLTPANCVPRYKTLFIENVTTDVGLSPPYNSLFTFFGQFFDHGVDQTVKSSGTVIVPLKSEDPLVAGPDHIFGNADDLDPHLRFIALTRAQNQPGPDGIIGTADDVQDANNTDTPWVDQSQTYTSHSSHQVFLRQYVSDGAGHPVSTGRLLGGLPAGQTYAGSPDGTDGMSTWASTKKQAAELLGLRLVDKDVFNVPTILTDPYGNFVPGPARGLPQYVTATGLVEGNLASPVAVPANVLYFDTPFLTDIAHNAEPQPGLTPDADDTPSADFAHQPAGTYDNEMLDAHFTCGDGRCNENIALSTIHQIFHSEHDRLANQFDSVTLPANASLSAGYHDTNCAIGCATNNPALPTTYTYGQRLFQAARFVTEMEYQHLVFEEFARKVQPAIRPFHVYSPDINPAVKAEFAHAVYRFGHSMLDDDVARTDVAADNTHTDNSLPLLTAFLNPPEYFHDGTNGFYTPQQAAGAIVMGSSDQSGNELDEFINDTLRNNLLGLPLDLATFNLTRARSEGIPPLNSVRRKIFAETNDGQLAPYSSWSDFGQHLKHPESLINFVAAYGKHPSITNATTVVAKRNAARAIVDPQPSDVPPADASDFMFGTGAWSSDANGVTNTGLDDVDLWVGGLAEVTNLFGGLLGSTFNYVFQTQLESLQDGDRLYYLARTPGLNLRTQLEGNSFSELIQRNTDGTNTLKADAFATADCKFQLSHLAGTPQGYLDFGATVADDPTTTDCNENLLLLRQPDGTIKYRQTNTVDPPGINGQAVYQGTDGVDRIYGGNDNDTFWGGTGNDRIEGNGGDDVALGGEGNDIITDLDGADTPKGGPGNDAIDGGPGDDIPMGNEGQDFINGGANDNESFAGPGNDFVIAGQGADAVFGDGGDDWIEGGTGQDLLQGDHGAPFFDDPGETAPGNDIMVGQAGENDYDTEGGDDLMSQNAAVDRNAGAGGFDWAFHQYDTVGGDDDMSINNNLVGVPIQVVVNRDRWQETEADSGSSFNDVIRGTDDVPTALGGAGFAGCDAIDQAGIDRITGLAALITPDMLTVPAATLDANAAAGSCPLSGNVWGDGEILIGGGGSDTITGRGANDVIDGDRALKVRIDVHANNDGTGAVIGTTDLMEHTFQAGNPKTLQQAVFDGSVDPGQLVAARELIPAPAGDRDSTSSASSPAPAVDTAVFLGPRASYTVTTVGDHLVVNQTGALGANQKVSDGIDTLRNIEQLRFTNDDGTTQTVVLSAPATPTIGTATGGNASADVTWTPAATGEPASSFDIQVLVGGVQDGALRTAPASDTSAHITGLANGTTYTFKVRAVGAFGASAFSAESNAVTPAAVAPSAPTIGTATAGVGSASVTWTAPANNGGSPVTGYLIQARNAANTVVGSTTAGPGATSATVTGLNAGAVVRLRVRASNAVGDSPFSADSNAVTVLADTTAPTVAARAPAAGATGVAQTANVTATFSEPVQGVSGTTFRLRNTLTGLNVPATVTTSGNTATLTPTSPLANNTQYTATLTGGATAIRDLAGNPLATTTWNFRTALDTTAPTIVSRSPAPGATGVPVGSNVVVTFSEPVTAGANSFTLTNAAGVRVLALVTLSADGRTLTLDPLLNLTAGRTYTVGLTNGIRDLAGNRLAPVTWTFGT